MKISEILTEGARKLEASGVPEHIRESASLLQFALDKDRVFLYSYPDYELRADENERFQNALNRRLDREPLQYITGRQEFCGLEFAVTADVLIPRPETEMLAAKSIELLLTIAEPRFAEIGVGSGCIAVAILHNVPAARATGADISANAIAVARNNSERHNVADRLELVQSDLFTDFPPRRFDLIVSNPPYVPAADIPGLQPEVRNFEPLNALTDGLDGLAIIERIVDSSPRFLKPGGYLILEIGFAQAARVLAGFDPSIWTVVEIVPDFQGIPRMTVARCK